MNSNVIIIFLFSTLLTLNLHADSNNSTCGNEETYSDFISCLNKYFLASVSKGSAANTIFEEEFKSYSNRYGFKHKATPLDKMFTLKVLETGDSDVSDSKKCFEFEENETKKNQEISEHVENQINEVSLFLAKYHAKTFGRQSTLIFPIREVRICSSSQTQNRNMIWQNRLIFFGVDSNKLLTAHNLKESWDVGNPIRRFDKDYFDGSFNAIPIILGGDEDENVFLTDKTKRQYFTFTNGGAGAVMWDLIAGKPWLLLNPISRERIGIVGTLMGNISDAFSYERDHTNSSAQEQLSEMKRTMDSGPGFTEKHYQFIKKIEKNDEWVKLLYNAWRISKNDPQNTLNLIENAALNMTDQKSGNSAGKVVVAIRKMHVKVGVTNLHDINVVSAPAIVPWDDLVEKESETSICIENGGNSAEYRSGDTHIVTKNGGCGDVIITLDEIDGGVREEKNGDKVVDPSIVGTATMDIVRVQTTLFSAISSALKRIQPDVINRASLRNLFDSIEKHGPGIIKKYSNETSDVSKY